MRVGEVCIFEIPMDDGVYSVRCECYDGIEGVRFGSTFYRYKIEILHTGDGRMIDTADKARKAIEKVIKLREKLLQIDWDEDDGK